MGITYKEGMVEVSNQLVLLMQVQKVTELPKAMIMEVMITADHLVIIMVRKIIKDYIGNSGNGNSTINSKNNNNTL